MKYIKTKLPQFAILLFISAFVIVGSGCPGENAEPDMDDIVDTDPECSSSGGIHETCIESPDSFNFSGDACILTDVSDLHDDAEAWEIKATSTDGVARVTITVFDYEDGFGTGEFPCLGNGSREAWVDYIPDIAVEEDYQSIGTGTVFIDTWNEESGTYSLHVNECEMANDGLSLCIEGDFSKE